jgi:hypothetical protein
MTMTIDEADQYMAERTGRYEWRAERYRRAADVIYRNGLFHENTVYDIGAGMTEFDYLLRDEYKWRGRYIPIDQGIDPNHDLETWVPPRTADYAVCLEILEHLRNPARLVRALQQKVSVIVVSVPNPRTVDVLGIDPTHVSIISQTFLESLGLQVTEEMFYGGAFSNGEPDSLFGVWGI